MDFVERPFLIRIKAHFYSGKDTVALFEQPFQLTLLKCINMEDSISVPLEW